jgi:hypothetical protein
MRAEVATAYHWRFPRSVLARVIARDCDATGPGVSLCRVWSRPPPGNANRAKTSGFNFRFLREYQLRRGPCSAWLYLRY